MASPTGIQLIRTVRFASGHRYWNPEWTGDENRLRFGTYASPYNHGHNYVLDVAVSGKLDSKTAMVVNIKRLDDLLQEKIVQAFNNKSLNDEIPEFTNQSPSLENFLEVIRHRIMQGSNTLSLSTGLDSHATINLVSLKLAEMHNFWATLTLNKMTLTRTYEFAAAHRLNIPSLSQEENQALFGKCNNLNGHGHNYFLEVTVSGKVDAVTGMMVDLMKLDQAVNELVVEKFDHKFLDKDIPEFYGKPTTTESVTQAIFDRLYGNLPIPLVSVRLYETARSAFEIAADD